MNTCNINFLQANGINLDEITRDVDCKIYSIRDINEILERTSMKYQEDAGVQNISIGDVVGVDCFADPSLKINSIFDFMDTLFDEKGDSYHCRSLGLLQYNRENIIEMLKNSFKYDPLYALNVENGKYVITTNGLHRFTVLRILYLKEIQEALDNTQKIEEVKEKYKIPMVIRKIDFTKIYLEYIIRLTQPMDYYGCRIIECEASNTGEEDKYDWNVTFERGFNEFIKKRFSYDDILVLSGCIYEIRPQYENFRKTGNIEVRYFNGENKVFDNIQFIEYAKQVFKNHSNIHEIEEKLAALYTKYSSFKTFIDNYFADIFHFKDKTLSAQKGDIND